MLRAALVLLSVAVLPGHNGQWPQEQPRTVVMWRRHTSCMLTDRRAHICPTFLMTDVCTAQTLMHGAGALPLSQQSVACPGKSMLQPLCHPCEVLLSLLTKPFVIYTRECLFTEVKIQTLGSKGGTGVEKTSKNLLGLALMHFLQPGFFCGTMQQHSNQVAPGRAACGLVLQGSGCVKAQRLLSHPNPPQ